MTWSSCPSSQTGSARHFSHNMIDYFSEGFSQVSNKSIIKSFATKVEVLKFSFSCEHEGSLRRKEVGHPSWQLNQKRKK